MGCFVHKGISCAGFICSCEFVASKVKKARIHSRRHSLSITSIHHIHPCTLSPLYHRHHRHLVCLIFSFPDIIGFPLYPLIVISSTHHQPISSMLQRIIYRTFFLFILLLIYETFYLHIIIIIRIGTFCSSFVIKICNNMLLT